MTNDLGLVSSVSVWLGTQDEVLPSGLVLAIAQGVIHVEIWDDKEGRPGSKVGSLGDIDIPSIRSRFEGGTVAKVEDAVVGLKPNSIYHVVFNFSDSGMFVKRCCGGGPDEKAERRETVFFAFWKKDPGANPSATYANFDTVEEPFMLDGEFSVTPEIIYRWQDETLPLFMTVTESPEDCPPLPLEDPVIQRLDNTISLTWKSTPSISYIVEYSENLESWIEIDDSVESQGTETVFNDTDSVRLKREKGFYRVRLAN